MSANIIKCSIYKPNKHIIITNVGLVEPDLNGYRYQQNLLK